MLISFKNAAVCDGNASTVRSLLVADGSFIPSTDETAALTFDSFAVFPGFADVHVHLREPGFSYKETIRTGSMACAHGGYTDVCAMPNLKPTPDSLQNLAVQQDIIRRDAVMRVHPYGTITEGEQGQVLSNFDALSPHVVAFSDDGRGVQDEAMMEKAMLEAKKHGKIIAAHCEDNALLHGGYIHDGAYAAAHNHRGICSASEYEPIKRDLALAAKTGCAYHVCHISTKESVALIREAKKAGVDVTCETGPHYLLLCEDDLQEDGRFKMNPPLRSAADKEALLEGLADGTIDMIATDHAPHSADEKSRGLENSLMGVVGIETAFPLLYTYLVKTGTLSLERLIALLHTNPCKRFGIGRPFSLEGKADCTVFDLSARYTIHPSDFLSMGKSTPFLGTEVYGKCMFTFCDGQTAYSALS